MTMMIKEEVLLFLQLFHSQHIVLNLQQKMEFNIIRKKVLLQEKQGWEAGRFQRVRDWEEMMFCKERASDASCFFVRFFSLL
ncbi:UNVERIFIED_ORG: hypothetical protein BDK47_11644 [Anoxybacillus amylolyticus]